MNSKQLAHLVAEVFARQFGIDPNNITIQKRNESDCACLACALRRKAGEPETTMERVLELSNLAANYRNLRQNVETLTESACDEAQENLDKMAVEIEGLGYPAVAAQVRAYAKVCHELLGVSIEAKREIAEKQEAMDREHEQTTRAAGGTPEPATAG